MHLRRSILIGTALLALCASPAFAEEPAHHDDTVQELSGVDIEQSVAQSRLQSMDVGVAAPGLTGSWCGTETTSDYTATPTFDPALPQFKVVYAYPADRPDRFNQWHDSLQADLSLIEQFVSSQPGSTRAPRFDMGTACGPEYLDIQTVALPGPRSSYLGNMNAVESYVKTKLNPSPGGPRNYMIIADTLTAGGLYGLGELYTGSASSERSDIGNVHNAGGLTAIMWAADAAAPGIWPFWPEGVLHEMTHNMGGVQWSAPHSTEPAGPPNYQYGHCWDGRDVMCYQDGPAPSHPYVTTVCGTKNSVMPQPYDCNQDDYFNPSPPAGSYLATHWNVYNSVFMTECSALPANACLSSEPIGLAVNSDAPHVSGSAVSGQTLTATTGTWSPTGRSYAYQWQRATGAGWTNIPGATAAAFKLSSTDKAATVRVRVNAVNPYGTVSAYSAAIGPVATIEPVNVALPVVSGTTVAGWTLSATLGTWSPAGTSYAYQWRRTKGGVVTNLGTGPTYVLQPTDKDATVSVAVTATNADGSTRVTSADVGPVTVAPPVNTSRPTISGPVRNGELLTASKGTWSPEGPSYSYVWQQLSAGTWRNITGGTAAIYRLTAASKGMKIHVRVTSGGVTAQSADVGPVAAAPPVNSAQPTASGLAAVGRVLNGTRGTWSTAGTTYTYAWMRSSGSTFVDINGANAGTYKLTAADRGHQILLGVVAVNGDGKIKAYSQKTAVVAATAASSPAVAAGDTASVRSPGGVVMASATVAAGASAAAVGNGPRLTLTVHRAERARGRLKVAVCPVANRGAPAQRCTRPRKLGSRAVAVKVAAASGRVQVVLTR